MDSTRLVQSSLFDLKPRATCIFLKYVHAFQILIICLYLIVMKGLSQLTSILLAMPSAFYQATKIARACSVIAEVHITICGRYVIRPIVLEIFGRNCVIML